MTGFKPMLAAKAELDQIRYPVLASPKLDGIRCSIVNGQALTRTLKKVPNQYVYQNLSWHFLDGLDGELIVGSPTSKTVYADTVSGVMRFVGQPKVTFYVFDQHDTPAAYCPRRRELAKTLTAARAAICIPIVLLEQEEIHDQSALLAYETKCLDKGYEGLILRSPLAAYKYGRSTVKEGGLLKLKRFEDSEAVVIGIEEEMHNGNAAETNELGRTKRSSAKAGKSGKGTMGALIVRDLHTHVEFNIGTGFTAEQRAQEWELGQIVKYKHFPVGVKDRPRHPVYLGLRSKCDL